MVKKTKLAVGWVDVPVAALRKAPWNYKHDDAEKLAKLVENMRQAGQIETILLRDLGDGTFEVANGNHRLDAFIELGIETVHAYNLGAVPVEVAARYAIQLNETKFDSDDVRLSELMAEIMKKFDVGELALTMPWTGEQLEAIRDFHTFDFDSLENPDNVSSGSAQHDVKIVVTVPRRQERAVRESIESAMKRFKGVTVR